MSVFLLSYGVINYDGRLEELIDVSNRIGETSVVACTLDSKLNKANLFYIKDRNSRYTIKNYLKFLLHSIKAYKKEKEKNVLIIDDFMAVPIGLILNFMYKPKLLIQDSRELYLNKKMPGLGKYLLFFEKIIYRKADLIICANKERAEIMKENYNLSQLPYVFENIRFLKGNYDEKTFIKKYSFLDRRKINIISSGGCSVERGTLNLIDAMKHLPDHRLLIVGKGRSEDYKQASTYLYEHNIENVIIIDRVPLEELKFLLKNSDIGIVEYHKKDLNNLYCASGKTYEYMNEGLPLVTTENIPLKKMCNEYLIGVADDDFHNGIKIVSNNLSSYKNNVQNFIKNISVDSNNQSLANKIIEIMTNKEAKNRSDSL